MNTSFATRQILYTLEELYTVQGVEGTIKMWKDYNWRSSVDGKLMTDTDPYVMVDRSIQGSSLITSIPVHYDYLGRSKHTKRRFRDNLSSLFPKDVDFIEINKCKYISVSGGKVLVLRRRRRCNCSSVSINRKPIVTGKVYNVDSGDIIISTENIVVINAYFAN